MTRSSKGLKDAAMADEERDIAALGGPTGIQHLESRLGELCNLGGKAKVSDMLVRFAAQLETFLAPEAQTPWAPGDIHRMTGLAAMLGFCNVEATWRTLEADTPSEADRMAARKAAHAAITFTQRWR